MRRPHVAAGVLLAVLLALAGCSGPQVTPPKDAGVQVDSPALRAAKRDAGIATCRPGAGDPVTGGLPDVTLSCLGGGPSVQLASLRGPLVVNVWGQWCGPCREELPRYAAFARKYAGRVAVLGIDWQDVQPRAALQMAGRSRATYPQLADPGGRLRLRGAPQLMLVDRTGRVVFEQYLEVRSEAQLERLVAQHLGVAR
jgi:thiol-disulfide isomerase/thioredoxin